MKQGSDIENSLKHTADEGIQKSTKLLSDIEIAQNAKMQHIREIASKLGIEEDDLEMYGKYKAKISEGFIRKIQDRPDG